MCSQPHVALELHQFENSEYQYAIYIYIYILVHRLLEDIFIRLLRRWRNGRCGVNEWEKILVKVDPYHKQIGL